MVGDRPVAAGLLPGLPGRRGGTLRPDGRRPGFPPARAAAPAGIVLAGALLAAFPSLAAPPVLGEIAFAPASPIITGTTVTLSVTASDPDGDPIELRWDFGDGSPRTDWTLGLTSIEHLYEDAGVLTVLVQARDGSGVAARAATVVFHEPVSDPPPTLSAPILFDGQRSLVWAVNPDHDSITALAADLSSKVEIAVCDRPRSLALDGQGVIWVACRDDDRLSLVDAATRTPLETLDLPYGAAPEAVAASPDGSEIYLAEAGAGRVRRFRASPRGEIDAHAVGPDPRALAVTPDGGTLLVTRFISGTTGGEVWRLDLASGKLLAPIVLAPDTTSPDSGSTGRGVPNQITGVAVAPAGATAWTAAKKDNVFRGQHVEGTNLTFQTTSRSLVSRLDLGSGLEVVSEREDIDDHALPAAIVPSPLGSHLFVTFPGNRRLVALVAATGAEAARVDTEAGPIGVAVDPATHRVYVLAELDRSVQLYDGAAMLTAGSSELPLVGSAPTVDSEVLPPQVLLGKKVFADARDPRMALEGYLSCATCHLEGGQDGRVWDFTQDGEGLRNATTLRGLGRSGQGLIHWTGNFDEVQDFETPIRQLFGGTGFMSDADFAATSHPLGAPKAGLSAELDALAAYVLSLQRVDRSPHRNPDGTATAAAVAGREVFAAAGCAGCHFGSSFTDSALGLRHDVGTITLASGFRLGEPLDGFDTPSLLGIWRTAPYFHDGSAATLRDVVTTLNASDQHGTTSDLSPAEIDQLVAYLQQLDGSAEPFAAPGSLIFADGFESGDTGAWSLTAP